MAKYKNQHFVPQCYLRNFSADSDGKAICLLHIKSRKFVRGAPIKGQCARPYFYGGDLELERALQNIEGEYARALRNAIVRTREPHGPDLEMLRDFMILQSSRTEAMTQKTKTMWQGGQDAIEAEHPGSTPELDLSTHHMMLMAMSMFTRTRRHSTDLKVCLVRNKTSVPFVTSDDPVAFTSMFHAEKLNSDRFGFGSAGALFFMPLSPKLLLLCYDSDTYILSGKKRNSISLSKDRDVRSCNELQYLKAAQAIYFSDWQQRCELDREFNLALPRRKSFKPEIDRFIPDGSTTEDQRYRRLGKDEKGAVGGMLFAFSFPQILPLTWISPLRFRKNIRCYYNGSAAGYVRLHTRQIDTE